MSQTERRFLRALRAQMEQGFPMSAVPATCKPMVMALETCGAVECRRSGRGETIRVKNLDAFELFVSSRYPIGLEEPEELPRDRIDAVRLLGNAKTALRGRYEGLLLRSVKPGVAIVNQSGNVIQIAELTELCGAAAITLEDSRRYRFAGRVVVVENAEPFWQFEQEVPEGDLAIYAAGRLSERVLSWLASEEMAECDIVQWGDYDPVGCTEYLRLKGRCGDRVSLHAPSRVDALLPVHGKTTLLTEQTTALTQLRRLALPPEVTRLMELFDRHQRALEQEALLM
ncbi:MAG: hypothetical protein JJU33_04325 [Phycisphaerales bacterium]|nr:hypothetical protein [Phycisphaerales bacterium]